jgi:stringent starvation protein B
MTSNKPYLIRALNEWIIDNDQTPHIIVDVNAAGVPKATRNLLLSNESVSFQARFSGKPYEIFIPIDAVMAIYARENGQGMMFANAKDEEQVGAAENSPAEPQVAKPQAGSHLKLIK